MDYVSVMKSLNWIDGIFLFILVIALIRGYSRGFVREVVSLITLVVAFFVASMFSAQLADILSSTFMSHAATGDASYLPSADTLKQNNHFIIALSFLMLFFATVFLGMLISRILNLAAEATFIGFGNSLLGSVLGLAKGLIFNLVVIFAVTLTSYHTAEPWKNAQVVKAYEPAVQWLGNLVSPALSDLGGHSTGFMQRLGL